jgi:hypothetical protein
MGGKAKPTKHTAKEIAKKSALATVNASGGKAGELDRKGGKAGHSKYQCPQCMQAAPDLKSMKLHFESKHPKATWDDSKFEDLHEKHGGTTTGVAVRGGYAKLQHHD